MSLNASSSTLNNLYWYYNHSYIFTNSLSPWIMQQNIVYILFRTTIHILQFIVFPLWFVYYCCIEWFMTHILMLCEAHVRNSDFRCSRNPRLCLSIQVCFTNTRRRALLKTRFYQCSLLVSLTSVYRY